MRGAWRRGAKPSPDAGVVEARRGGVVGVAYAWRGGVVDGAWLRRFAEASCVWAWLRRKGRPFASPGLVS